MRVFGGPGRLTILDSQHSPFLTGDRLMKRLAVALSMLSLLLAPVNAARAQQKSSADAEFLSKVIPGIASSVKIIEYAQKNASDEKVREFAGRVAKQHKESLKTASDFAKRLNVAVVSDPVKDSKPILDQWSKLKGADLDVAFLEWLSHIHHDTSLFEGEVQNGTDAAVKTYAQNSITSGNEHLNEAHQLLEKMKK